MVLGREDYLNRIRERIGESTADEDIAFLEDMTDTYEDMSSRLADETDWKQKYLDNDAEWRKRYIDRFDGKVQEDPNIELGDDPAEGVVTEYSDLFKTID